MQLFIGADVRRPDGDRLGAVRGAIFDPATQQVMAMVVERAGLLGGDVVVPLGVVNSTDDEAVVLSVSREQFDSMRRVVDRNVAPPPSQTYSGEPVDGDLDVPDVPPVGAATGVESIAFTPVVEETLNVPPGDEVIEHDTTVWATDGELGQVRGIQVDDETHRLVGVSVEHGLIFQKDFEVPAQWVVSVRPDAIALSVSKSQVEVANRDSAG